MLQPKPQKPPGPSPEDVVLHNEFLKHPRTQAILADLQASDATNIEHVLNNFITLDTVTLKVLLQNIKTNRNLISCLQKLTPSN